MRILVVGAGGAGGYFGARWAQIGLDVTVIARGRHLNAIQANGITLRTPTGETRVQVRAESDARDVGDVDFVLFATKSWQLREAVELVRPWVSAGTAVLGIQNGVGSAEELLLHFPVSDVLGGTCRIISLVEEPGVIRHVGIDPTIVLGELGGGHSERTSLMKTTLGSADGVDIEISGNVQLEIWRKFLFFSPVSGIGSVTRSPIGILRSVPESRVLLAAAVEEVCEVAKARGVALDSKSVTETLTFIDGLPMGGISSMHRDFEAARPSELEALAGTVSRMGRDAGVATPVHDFIYSVLLPMELKARGDLSWPDIG